MNKTITLTDEGGNRVMVPVGQFYVYESSRGSLVNIIGEVEVVCVKESFDEIRDMIEGNPAKKKPVEKFDFKKELISRGASVKHATDWMEVRRKKKAANTQTAFDGFIREVEKASLTVPLVVQMAAINSWAGFKSEWVTGAPTNGKTNNQTPSDRQRHAAEELRRKQQANPEDDSLI